MSAMAPVYSADPNDRNKRYHNNDACTEQNNIEPKWRRAGTGGYPLCHHCDTLNKQGK